MPIFIVFFAVFMYFIYKKLPLATSSEAMVYLKHGKHFKRDLQKVVGEDIEQM